VRGPHVTERRHPGAQAHGEPHRHGVLLLPQVLCGSRRAGHAETTPRRSSGVG
jgi:hypothetical protein